MLYVLLLLLKILGILLLLFIGLVLLVLLTPIQYSFELEKEEQREPKFMVRVTWLFWLFYFKTSYIEKVFDYRIRILGYQIAGNQPEFLEKQKERQKKKSQKEKAKEERKTAETPAEGKSRSILFLNRKRKRQSLKRNPQMCQKAEKKQKRKTLEMIKIVKIRKRIKKESKKMERNQRKSLL